MTTSRTIYWNTVLSPTADAERIVSEYDLTGPRSSVDEWLAHAESEAVALGAELTDVEECHEWALDLLMDAIETNHSV